MRGRGLLAVLAVACAIALVGVGCGGGGSDESSEVTATTELSKATFAKKAEAICQENYERVKKDYEAFVKKNGGSENAFSDPERSEEYGQDVIIAQKKKTVEELEALGTPKGEEKKFGELLEAYEEGIQVGEEEPSLVMTGQGVFPYATHIAEGMGLKSCRY